MSSADVIDALFDRTVDVVQSLPKSGPIQTSYEEKLALYSLYKQATEGDVTTKRPGMLDMLGRAKWDAWSKRQGMDSLDAKQLYVESMMRTLRKFEDRREARALIQELENFSGDVAERVMRGALATDDTASEASSAPAPLRHQTQRLPFETAADSDTETDEGEDEEIQAREIGDRLTSLRNPAALTSNDRRRSTAARSTGGVSAQAQPPSVSGRERARPGSTMKGDAGATKNTATTPQWDETNARIEEEESDDDTYSAGRSSHATSYLAREREDEESRLRALRAGGTSSTAMQQAAIGNRRQIAQQRQGGQTAPSSSQGAGSRVGPTSQQQGIRPSASTPGFYSSTGPGGRVIPAPPRSESNVGGGAGASLYSAVGPSSRGAVEQHHHYHRTSDAGVVKAPTSSAPSARGGGGGGGGQAEVEQALQSIQASLAALHERLNRVEVRSGAARHAGSSIGSSGVYGSAYNAIRNALHDIGALFGLASTSGSTRDGARSKVTTPSFGSSNTIDRHRNGAAGSGNRGGPSRFSSLLSFLVSLLNLSLRLALDLTSLGILITLFLFLVRKATGRGDPLLLLRMARTLLGRARNSSSPAVGASAGVVVQGGRRKVLEGGALVAGLGAAAGGAIREVAGSLASTGKGAEPRQDGLGAASGAEVRGQSAASIDRRST